MGMVRAASLHAVYEYLLVTAPVGLYILLEAVEKREPEFLVFSPEWSIATMFLSFQGVVLFRRDLVRTGRKLSSMVDLIGLVAVLVVAFSAINAYLSLHDNTVLLIVLRLILFALVSFIFLVLVGAGKREVLRAEINNDKTFSR